MSSATVTATPLRVKVFRGAQNLPLLVAREQGYFGQQGLDVELLYTRDSLELRNGLAGGDFHIAHTAADNAVAMKDIAGQDVAIFMGGDSGLNELFAQPGISAIAGLAGGTLVVDAPDTAYALQAKKVLADAGLVAGRDFHVKPLGATYQRIRALREDASLSASILNPPFSEQARQEGFVSLGRIVDLVGPYQATTGFAMRPWLRANADIVVAYVRAYLRALDFIRDPSNRAAMAALLARELDLSADVAASTCAALLEPGFGLDERAALDKRGMRNVLAIRRQFEAGADTADPARYIDMRYYDKALAK